jgi:roadblock/LC7 domain-containing protein
MSDFDNIGKLMHLPISDIELTTEIKESNSLISIAAESILKSNGRNWIPVIVTEVADYQYQVVSNQLVYVAAREAKLDRVWCIVIDHAPETLDQISILNKESNPIINLCTASRETIKDALLLLLGRQDAVTLRRVNL